MKTIIILSILSFSFPLIIFGQNRTLTGKIVDNRFNPVGGVRIESSDNILLTTTELQTGNFKIKLSDSTKCLVFRSVGYDKRIIYLSDSCYEVEIILVRNVFSETSLEKTDNDRLKQFIKLPKLHRKAFMKGIFKTEHPCYQQQFFPISESKHFQKII